LIVSALPREEQVLKMRVIFEKLVGREDADMEHGQIDL
jgi:hypothetical protein